MTQQIFIEDIEDLLEQVAMVAICQPGQNDIAVSEWWQVYKNDLPRKKDCVAMLRDYGAWSHQELAKQSLRELQEKVLWCAAWNKSENQ